MGTYFGKIIGARPRTLQTAYSYPATTYGYAVTGSTDAGTWSYHVLHGTGAPSSDHDNAPNGSVYFDYTNKTSYVKAGAPGSGKGGAWGQT